MIPCNKRTSFVADYIISNWENTASRFLRGKSLKCRVRCLGIFTGEKSLSGISLCWMRADVPSNFLLCWMGPFLFLERVIKSRKLSGGPSYLEEIIIKGGFNQQGGEIQTIVSSKYLPRRNRSWKNIIFVLIISTFGKAAIGSAEE